jgi:RNase P subunit RPR2
MTEMKKRRQGQIKPDGTKAEPKQICTDCGAYLQNAYIKKKMDNKRVLIVIGRACPDCGYIERTKTEKEG